MFPRYSLATLLLVGCAHQQAAEAEQSPAPTVTKPAVSSMPSNSEVHSIPRAQLDSSGNCNAHCPENLWECACAFAIKTGTASDCREEFRQDHDTLCAEETLEECLVVVMRVAAARSDFELAKATELALQCVRSKASDAD
ncbi:MAG: hypothetical protein OSB21_07605 [Myxococcota bacterium]|nr:hypothetical protein [Myxococcota bacterium]